MMRRRFLALALASPFAGLIPKAKRPTIKTITATIEGGPNAGYTLRLPFDPQVQGTITVSRSCRVNWGMPEC